MKNKEEIKHELKEFCFEYGYNDGEVEVVPLGDERYLITITQMYETPLPERFKGNLLEFFEAVKNIVDCNFLQLKDEISEGGCETCDYGSKYGWSFIASNRKEDE
jgi:hypothetical protein